MNTTIDAVNLSVVRNVLPETWTNVANLNWLQIGFHLKLAGIDWRSDRDLTNAMAALERAGVVQRDGYCIRRTPL